MSTADQQKKVPQSDKPEPKQRAERDEPKAPIAIDFAKLDLSIEKVDERISPGETNVFDK